jgi:hypothetical protein
MPTNFPDGNDSFIEPSSPETTPLSSAGSGNKDHYNHHKDLGDAVEALQANVPLKGHDHSGTGPRATPKLKQANTHEEVDTDTSATAIHHTLGPGANQAARGNHTHNATDIIGMGWTTCTSTTRPASPPVGMTIYETDTNRVYVWATFPPAVSPSWRLLPIASYPICRLLQGVAQKITPSGSIIEWRTEEEDNFGMFSAPASLTEITIPVSGLYEVATSVAWNNTDLWGDWAETVVLLNGQETYRRNFEFIRGRSIFSPGKPQTVATVGKIRYNAGDKIGVKAKHNGSSWQWTYSSTSDKQDTRIEITYVSP